jgi:hypothetical protein
MSNTILSNLIKDFDPNGSLSVVADNPDLLRVTSKTSTLMQGRRVPFRATIGNNEYSAFATLRSAHLHRITVIEHTSNRMKGRTSNLVTGIFKPVTMDIDLVIGDEIISLQDLMRLTANASASKELSSEQFSSVLEDLGMRFTTGMNLFWQQFGARQDGVDHLIEVFQSAGAENVHGKIKDPRRIKQAYQMPRNSENSDILGPQVISMEIGRANREESLTNQGFIDFADATMTNYRRVVELRKTADALRSTNALQATAEGWSPERKESATKEVTEMIRLSQQWSNNWTGAQQRILVDDKDPEIMTPQAVYDPTAAPCGRFSMIVNNEEVKIDLWSNSLRANTSTDISVPSTSSEEVAVDDSAPIQWSN